MGSNIMVNVKTAVKGDVLTITVDLRQSQGASKSGKSEVIASTQGNVTVDGADGVKMGLNVYRTAKAA